MARKRKLDTDGALNITTRKDDITRAARTATVSVYKVSEDGRRVNRYQQDFVAPPRPKPAVPAILETDFAWNPDVHVEPEDEEDGTEQCDGDGALSNSLQERHSVDNRAEDMKTSEVRL